MSVTASKGLRTVRWLTAQQRAALHDELILACAHEPAGSPLTIVLERVIVELGVAAARADMSTATRTAALFCGQPVDARPVWLAADEADALTRLTLPDDLADALRLDCP